MSYNDWIGSEEVRFFSYHMKKTAGTLVLQSLLPLGDIIFIASAAFDQGWYQVGLAGRDGRDMWHSGILGLMTLLPIENENSFVF